MSSEPTGSLSDPQRLVVVGLGYVGLPLAVEAARAGLRSTGLDVNAATVDRLNAGLSHVDDISNDDLDSLPAGSFTATTDAECIADADVVVICVPTPLDENRAPDLSAVDAATETIARHLRPGMLVVLESTTYPGTTDGPVRATLETSGLVAGQDFALAFSPERIDPGNPTYTLRNTPKVVGGLTPSCADRAIAFYEQVVDTVVRTKGPREAELSKLLENTYRHVNIALVNEMAVFSHDLGIDLWAAIDAAKTKPFGFTAFYPGPGVGGHCIPIDPNYLSHQVRTLGYQFRFVELAQEISQRMPTYVVRRLQDLLNRNRKPMNGSRVAVLGLTYKPDIADDRETPARPVIRDLRALGADVIAHDPHLERFDVDGQPVAMIDDLAQELGQADAVLLLQHHASYDLAEIVRAAPLLLDTRGRASGTNVELL